MLRGDRIHILACGAHLTGFSRPFSNAECYALAPIPPLSIRQCLAPRCLQ